MSTCDTGSDAHLSLDELTYAERAGMLVDDVESLVTNWAVKAAERKAALLAALKLEGCEEQIEHILCVKFIDGKLPFEDAADLARHIRQGVYFVAHTQYQVISAWMFKDCRESRARVHTSSTETNPVELMASEMTHEKIIEAAKDSSLLALAVNAEKTGAIDPSVTAMPADIRQRYDRLAFVIKRARLEDATAVFSEL